MKILLLFLCSLVPSFAQSVCNLKVISTTTSTNVLVAATNANKYLRICAVYIQVVQPSSPADFGITQGTGTTCGTGETSVTAQWSGVASSVQTIALDVPTNAELNSTAGKDVCVKLSATPTSIQVMILYRVVG